MPTSFLPPIIGHVNLLNRCGFCRYVCSWITSSFAGSDIRWSQYLSVAVLVDSMLSTQSVMEKALVVLLRVLPKTTLINIKTMIFITMFPLQANRSGIPIGSPPELTQKQIILLWGPHKEQGNPPPIFRLPLTQREEKMDANRSLRTLIRTLSPKILRPLSSLRSTAL